jgi:aspartate/methionine/tyrosine aminotransferase
VNQLCRDRAIYHISDEAYEYFHFDGTHFSPGSIEGADRYTITLFSLSKSYGMAGWRVGYMVIPTELELAVKKIQDTNLICPPIMSQLAGVAALQAGREWVFEQNRNLLSVRELVLSQLAALGERVRVPKPEGAFYALIETDTTQTDMEIVQRLIRDYGVATMPGSTFGVTDRTALRVAFGSLQSDTVAEGMGRLVRGLVEIL